MELRPYQIDAIERVRECIRAGAKNVLLCAPTGAGKTVIGKSMIAESEAKGKRSAFVVDRITLINQTSQVLDDSGIDHGVMQASHWRFRPSKRVQLCSAQTLTRRGWPDADLILVDECHAVNEVTKQRLTPRDTIAVGLTATPFTKGLGKLYDALVNVTTTNQLIADGFLSKYRIFAPSQPDMTGVKVVAGEWEEKETAKRALEVVGDCVAEYIKHGQGRKFICSAVNVAHVEELHRQFMAAGIICATYTYLDSDESREETVTEFRKPDSYIRGLITVTAASKGFDVPDIGVVIMARPLRKSLAEHIQFLGRGLRIHPSKSECLILDHSGNCERFWDDVSEFFEHGATELDDGKKKPPKKSKPKEDAAMVKCPTCSHLHKAMPFCPACGHTYPPKEAVKHAAGSLSELIKTGHRAVLTRDVWPQVVGYAIARREDPAAAKKLALALFKQMTGKWPASDFEATTPADLSPEVSKRIRALNIAYSKGRAKSHVALELPAFTPQAVRFESNMGAAF